MVMDRILLRTVAAAATSVTTAVHQTSMMGSPYCRHRRRCYLQNSYRSMSLMHSGSSQSSSCNRKSRLVVAHHQHHHEQQQQHTQDLLSNSPSFLHRRLFASSTTKDDSKEQQQQQDVDEEEWIPPQRTTDSKKEGTHTAAATATTTMTNGENQDHAVAAKLYTQQRRIDHATDALFVLTPEEEATMTDEELSRRVDEVLALEDELERQAFEIELQHQLQMEEEYGGDKNEQRDPTQSDSSAPVVDWLQTRRSVLGGGGVDGGAAKGASSIIPVKEHKLLTRDDIVSLLEFYGGHDIVVIHDDPKYPRMGGADGMIFCSSSSSSIASESGSMSRSPTYQYQQVFRVMSLTRGLVDHMKERRLDELGVPGAQLSLGKKSQQQQRSMSGRRSGNVGLGLGSFNTESSSWQIIDCRNYIVHIMDPKTRSNLNLEALWSGKDPLWKLDWTDDNAVDNYVNQDHNQRQQHNRRGDDDHDDHVDTGGTIWDDDGRLIHRLERTTYSTRTARHRPVIPLSTKSLDRRAGRRQRRRQREEQFRQRSR